MQKDDYQSSKIAGRTIKNSLYSVASFIWPLLLLLFSVPYFIHKLGTEQYGLWVLIMSTIGTMGVLNLGISDALIKFVSEYHAKKDFVTLNRIIGNTFLIYSLISVVVILVGLFILPHFIGFIGIKESHRKLAVFVLRIAIFGFVINLFMTNALSILKAFQRYDIPSKIEMVTNTIKIIGMMALLYLGFSLKEMAFAYVTSMAVGLMLILAFLKRNMPEISLMPSFNSGTIKMIFGFSIYSFLMGISGIIKYNVGNILVGRFLGVGYVPYFSVPLQVSTQILGAMRSLTTVSFPLFSSLRGVNKADTVKNIFVDASKLITALGFGIGGTIFLFSHNILSIWINPEFAAIANNPFKIMIIGFIFALTASVPYFFLMGSGYIKITASIQGLSMFLVLVLGPILVSMYGIVGISVSYTIATMILAIYVYYATRILWPKYWLNQIIKIYIRATISLFLVSTLFLCIGTVEAKTFLHLLLYASLFALILLVVNILLDKGFYWKYFVTIKRSF
jgi:O-antigen/teichoic acid export membrane protein